MDDKQRAFEEQLHEALKIEPVQDYDFSRLDEAVLGLEPVEADSRHGWQEWLLRAAALALVAGGSAWWFLAGPAAEPEFAQEDLNRDGEVNIVDAYLLAQRIQRNERLSEQWDFNADGAIDQADVAALSRQAVSLDVGGQG